MDFYNNELEFSMSLSDTPLQPVADWLADDGGDQGSGFQQPLPEIPEPPHPAWQADIGFNAGPWNPGPMEPLHLNDPELQPWGHGQGWLPATPPVANPPPVGNPPPPPPPLNNPIPGLHNYLHHLYLHLLPPPLNNPPLAATKSALEGVEQNVTEFVGARPHCFSRTNLPTREQIRGGVGVPQALQHRGPWGKGRPSSKESFEERCLQMRELGWVWCGEIRSCRHGAISGKPRARKLAKRQEDAARGV
ncbi:hypothetical protein P154DRAFT_566052 [Amniculicola lignicola CBS 123094]|uniref:Uncharacterized protein n=1 Tax=Amniculicola lignicola CBS 123094 TaxID=1392246 RepID=A0A6A5W697_9PLEO|nr:hypothetical protein P154DRAFT_566052 [Amniculicola lignicola CBS 123094]